MVTGQVGCRIEADAKRQPQVDYQIQWLEMNSEAMEKQIEELAQRLTPVSRGASQGPIPVNKEATAIEALCPMADVLRRSNERFARLVDRLAGIRGLLEI